MKIEIEQLTGEVLFHHVSEGNSVRATVEAAVRAGVNLKGANLRGVNLEGANLRGVNLKDACLARANLEDANLKGANLKGANLKGANLKGANLKGANIKGANLARANLEDAYLKGAYLADKKLIGERPVFQIGPIGSRCAYFVAYITDKGLRFDVGCQRQITSEHLEALIEATHGGNVHAKEYRAALALIDVHAEIWTQKG